MIQVDLSEDERQILVQVLDDCLSDLRMEIADTDRQDFRDLLKTRKAAIQKLLEILRAA